MKKILLTAVSMLAALGVYGQGQVLFQNFGYSPASPFYDVNGTTKLGAGSTFSIELWAGPSSSSLALITTFTGSFLGTTTPTGYFQGGTVAIPTVAGGAAGFAQLRMWDTQGGTITSFAQASSTANVRFGQGAVFGISPTAPPATPAFMTQMPSITLQVVPEPSTIALGILGAVGAFLLRRRK